MRIRDLFQSKKQLLRKFLKRKPVLIDVRNHYELLDNKIDNAINISLDNLYSELDRLDKNKAYLLFCRSGNRSRYAVDLMIKNGFTEVMDGGGINELKKII
jgi:phage shock protein E